MTQTNLWQSQPDSLFFSELCAGLYQREVTRLAKAENINCQVLQSRLKSLPHYIAMTAHAMMQIDRLQLAPLNLDIQNASWSAKQTSTPPLSGQGDSLISDWYLTNQLQVGLVVPILLQSTIILDCIDRIDLDKSRVRTNVAGWFTFASPEQHNQSNSNNTTLNSDASNKAINNLLLKPSKKLLKPNKKVMMAACAGHTWQSGTKKTPIMPSLRELLLSCHINWKNFKKSSDI